MSYYGDSMSYYYGGGAFANHSSLMTGTGRVYTPHRFAPHLSTISESPLSNYRRYAPVILPSRPKRIIDTADIDVSTPRTLHADHSRPGNRLRRDRPTIRIRSQALKDNPTLREHNERHEKTVGELLREKFFIKDKKPPEDAPKIRQLAHEPLEDPSEAPQGKLTRRMTRRRSSADIQMDPGQLERELAIAQVQAEVLDNLVAEEQAEIEVEVRRGTLLHKNQLRSAAVGKSESEADKSDDTKKKIPKKIKKKKKGTDKPSPPSSAPSTPGEDGKDPAKGFKIEACNSVGDFSTIVVNAKDKQKEIELRESVRLPPPKAARKMEEEEVVVLPIKKPYILDNSRNSVYLTLRQQIAKSSGPRDDEGATNQRSLRSKMDRIKKESDSKPANIRAKDTFKSDTEVGGVINVIDEETSAARCEITSDAKLLMKASEELSRVGGESSQGVIDESAVEETRKSLTRDFGKDVCEDMAITSEDCGEGGSLWELRGAGSGNSQVIDQGSVSGGSPVGKGGDPDILRKKEDEVMGDACSELKISDGKSQIAAGRTDILEKNKPLSKLKSSVSESRISDSKFDGLRKEKLNKSKSLSVESKASAVEKETSLECKKPSDGNKIAIKQETLVEKSKSFSIESAVSLVPKVKMIETTKILDESKFPVVKEISSEDKKLVNESQPLLIENEIPSILKPEESLIEKSENIIDDLKSSEDIKPSNESNPSPLEKELPPESKIEIREKEPLEKSKPLQLKEESTPIKEETPENFKPLSKSKSFTDSALPSLSPPDPPKLKPKPKMTKSKFLSTDSGIGSLELDLHHPEKKTKKKLQNSKGSSFECDEDPKPKLKRSEKPKIPPVKKLKKKLTSAKSLPLPLLNDPPKDIILTRVSPTEENPPKGPFKSLRSFPLAKSEPKPLPPLKEDEKTDEIDFWSEIRSSSPPKIDPPKLSLKPQLPDEIIRDEVKPNTSEIIQDAITKEVKLPEAIFDNLSSENSLSSESNCETAETTGMEVLLSPVSETQSEVPGDDVKSVEKGAVMEVGSTGVVETSDVETTARDEDRKLLLDVSGGSDGPAEQVPEEGSEPSTPVVEVPPLLTSVEPIPEVPEAPEDEDEDDSPVTPTNEDASGGLSKWDKTTDLTTLNGKNVPSSDAGNEVATPKVSKKKLSRRKKSGSEDTIVRRVPEKITSSTEVSKVCQFPKKNLKTSPPKPAKRPIDLNKMFYTTPSSLLTATPRDLAKVKRVKVKKEKHPVRTPSASSDSTGSTRSSQDTTSSRSNSTEVEDENGQKRISSTRSNDSGFDGSPRLSTPSQSSDNQRNSDSSDHVHGSGRITPPATNLPRFKKYTVEDFHFLKVLGKGSFGKVLLAELRGTDCVYAVKCLKKDVVLEDDDVECTLIERKVLTLATRHPYLCHLFCTFQTDSHLFFVMEYLNGGDLMFHIQKSGRFPEFRARFYAGEIWSGLNFLHKKGIVYRDLKLDNVLLDFEGHIRIADFGMCKLQIFLDRTADTFCGTPDYMAPEIIKGLKYNQAVDWWSFGVLLYEMLTGQSPFSGCDEDELFWSICNERPFIPRYLSQEAMDVLVALLEKDAGKRPMGHEIQAHAFFHSLSWDRLERRLLDPPFKPALEHTLDTRYFDTAFTAEKPRLTPVPEQILTSMDQGVFRGFSYTNPNATD
ncbi:FK506-binding protein 5 [Diachasma alloeum]|uniref:FK506-binding protein 5 n=1 Tax=Diachasma alloeum TaxID=454923 RepID=UPI0007383A86|nr:FK506-binding protein 5 [Diachasma alloeum]